jgi:hypothetical protein
MVEIGEAELGSAKPEPDVTKNRRSESGPWPIIDLSFRPESDLLKA